MKIILGILAVLLGTQAVAADGNQSIRIENRTGLAVTVYKHDLALIKDTRKISLKRAGRQTLIFEGVPQRILIHSTHVTNLQQTAQWQVLEQNYRYDLITSKALLDEYVGREVVLITYNDDNQIQERVRALLVAYNDQPVYLIGGNIYLDHPGSVVLPDAPENLVATPSLEWLVDATKGTHAIQAIYLTTGLAWQADYTLHTDADYETGVLTSWASITNKSGMAYPNAKLKLVAGTLNRITPQRRALYSRIEMSAARDAGPPQREQFLDYHLFDVPGTVTINQAQTKQIGLYPPAAVKLERQYRLEISENFMRRSNVNSQHPVFVHLQIANTSANDLGQPLPAGVVRVYSADQKAELQFAGESPTGAVAVDENMQIRLGTAFDIIGKVEVMDVVVKGSGRSQVRDVAIATTVTNRKPKTAVTVQVIPTFQEGWEILSASHKWSKLDSRRIKFEVAITAGKAVTINYKVRTK